MDFNFLGIPNFQMSKLQISKFPEIWPGPCLAPPWAHFGTSPAGAQLGPTALGPPGASLEPLWAQLGPSLDPAWAQLTWAQLGSEALGLAWAHLGSTALGLAWVQLGPNLNPAGAQLEPSLNPAWAQESLGPSLGLAWAQPGSTLGPALASVGPVWAHLKTCLGLPLDQLGSNLGPA